MRPTTPLAAAAVVAVALLSAGCGEREEPVGEIPVAFPITVQGAGDQPLELDGAPSRIVALDAGAAELVDALGMGDALVGAPGSATLSGPRPVDVVPEAGQIDVATAVSLEPDLVLATLETDRVDVAQVQRRSGAPVYIVPASTAEDAAPAVLELGYVLDRPAEARVLAGQIREDVAEIEDRLADVEPVDVFVDTGLFVTIRDASLFGDLLRRAKGTNIAPDPEAGPITAAELAARDPDVYIVTSDSGLTLDSLQRNADTRDLRAVREGNVVILPIELVAEPGADVAEALQTIAVALHPDAFG